ncbi:mitochondrial-processing peptidase subunit alpha-like protein [Tanacetum coccineum]
MVASEDIGRQILTYGERKPVEFLKVVDEVTAKDITSLAQKLLCSPLTMASHGDVIHVSTYDSNDLALKLKYIGMIFVEMDETVNCFSNEGNSKCIPSRIEKILKRNHSSLVGIFSMKDVFVAENNSFQMEGLAFKNVLRSYQKFSNEPAAKRLG